jgi:ketosteroid isomerase-like protein
MKFRLFPDFNINFSFLSYSLTNKLTDKLFMKSMVTNGILFLLILSSLIACNIRSPESKATEVDIEKIKKEIQAREDEFATLYNSGELKKIGYYADDAVTYYQNREPLVGSEARIEFFNSDIASSTNTISFTTNEVFVSSDGNMVVEIGYYKVVDSTNTAVNTGNYMSLFEKRDGKYVCLRDMSASDMPLE